MLIIYLLLAIYLLPLFSNNGSANDLTRWATTVSLVENTSFEISWTKDLIGDRSVHIYFGDLIHSHRPNCNFRTIHFGRRLCMKIIFLH
ncbi:MAG: hypothetical protein ACR2J3_08190 [Aridibacter sp.]